MGERPTTRPTGHVAEKGDPLDSRVTRNLNRRLFREMIKTDIEDRPLSWLKRRAFVRFAGRLGLDSFEARLIIRAVEYECGHVAPAAMADVEERLQKEYIEGPGGEEATLSAQLIAAGVIMMIAGMAWIIKAHW